MQDFKKLVVWQKAHALVIEVYAETATFPSEERFGLISQMRRAAVSIPSNIAEGSARGGNKEFGHFLTIACGSSSELEYLFILVADLAYLSPTTATKLADEVVEIRRMLSGLLAEVTPDS